MRSPYWENRRKEEEEEKEKDEIQSNEAMGDA